MCFQNPWRFVSSDRSVKLVLQLMFLGAAYTNKYIIVNFPCPCKFFYIRRMRKEMFQIRVTSLNTQAGI